MDLRLILESIFYIKFYEWKEKEKLIMKKVVNEVVKQEQGNNVYHGIKSTPLKVCFFFILKVF